MGILTWGDSLIRSLSISSPLLVNLFLCESNGQGMGQSQGAGLMEEAAGVGRHRAMWLRQVAGCGLGMCQGPEVDSPLAVALSLQQDRWVQALGRTGLSLHIHMEPHRLLADACGVSTLSGQPQRTPSFQNPEPTALAPWDLAWLYPQALLQGEWLGRRVLS